MTKVTEAVDTEAPLALRLTEGLGLLPGRAEFELWFGAPGRGLDRDGDGYRLMSARSAWLAWSAATAVTRGWLDLAPVAIVDTRAGLGLCAPTEADFPSLYALQGRRVRLVVDDGPNVRAKAAPQGREG